MTLNGAHGAIVITNGGERKQEEKRRSCSAGLEDGKWSHGPGEPVVFAAQGAGQ